MSDEKRSPAAEKLIEMVGINGSLQEALAEHPDLADGLDDFLAWRVRRAEEVEGSSQAPSTPHGLAKVFERPPPSPPPKKKK